MTRESKIIIDVSKGEISVGAERVNLTAEVDQGQLRRGGGRI